MDWFALFFPLVMGLLPLYDAQTPTNGPTGCAGPPVLCCPGQNSTCSRSCFCDEFCVTSNDCCPDYRSTCTKSSTTAVPERPITTNSTRSTLANNVATSSSIVSSTRAPTSAGLNVSTTSASIVSATTTTTTTTSETSGSMSTPADNDTTSSVSAKITPSTTDSETFSTLPSEGISKSASTEPAGTTQTETSTTLDTSSGTSSPADGDNSEETRGTGSDKDDQVVTFHLRVAVLSTNEANMDVLEAVSNKTNKVHGPHPTVLSIINKGGEATNKKVVFSKSQLNFSEIKFVSQTLLQQICEGCTTTIRHVKPT